MRCPIQSEDNAAVLLAYCARRLDPETEAVLERHMEQCPECRAFGERQRAVWEALEAWEALPVSPDFDQRLYERIEGARLRPGNWLRSARGWLPPSLPLAAASVLLAAVFLLRSPQPFLSPEAEQAELFEVERAEKALEDIEMLRMLDLMARAEQSGPQRM